MHWDFTIVASRVSIINHNFNRLLSDEFKILFAEAQNCQFWVIVYVALTNNSFQCLVLNTIDLYYALNIDVDNKSEWPYKLSRSFNWNFQTASSN